MINSTNSDVLRANKYCILMLKLIIYVIFKNYILIPSDEIAFILETIAGYAMD